MEDYADLSTVEPSKPRYYFRRTLSLIRKLKKNNLISSFEFDLSTSYVKNLKKLSNDLLGEIKTLKSRDIDLEYYDKLFYKGEDLYETLDIGNSDPLRPLLTAINDLQLVLFLSNRPNMRKYFKDVPENKTEARINDFFLLKLVLDNRKTFLTDLHSSVCGRFTLKKKEGNSRLVLSKRVKKVFEEIYYQGIENQIQLFEQEDYPKLNIYIHERFNETIKNVLFSLYNNSGTIQQSEDNSPRFKGESLLPIRVDETNQERNCNVNKENELDKI